MLSYGEIKKMEGNKHVALSPTLCAVCGRQIYHIREKYRLVVPFGLGCSRSVRAQSSTGMKL